MSKHFSANQYNQPFDPQRLQNWEVPLLHKEFPDTREGFTQIVTNDRGHLLEGVPRSSKNPWGDFLGTWDLPRKFVGNVTTYMGRTEEAADEIRAQIGKPVNKSFNKSIPDVPELPKILKYRQPNCCSHFVPLRPAKKPKCGEVCHCAK